MINLNNYKVGTNYGINKDNKSKINKNNYKYILVSCKILFIHIKIYNKLKTKHYNPKYKNISNNKGRRLYNKFNKN